MTDKLFDINECGYSIRCKLYCSNPGAVKRAVIFGHGFGGHKDNRAAEKFAGKIISKHKDVGVVTFNWPCHGDDARKNLLLGECDTYLGLVISFVKKWFETEEIYAYATSFGGYLFLKYIAEHGNPFRKVALRCPAIRMYKSITNRIMTEDNREKISKGKPVLVGFDRKIKISRDFLEDLKAADITKYDYMPYADDILILHGTKDEVIPFNDSADFADNNVIEFMPVENADHRFTDPKTMDLAIHSIIEFMNLS